MFNLAKYSGLETAPTALLDDTEDLSHDLSEDLNNQGKPGAQVETGDNPIAEQLPPDEQRISNMLASLSALEIMRSAIEQHPPQIRGLLESTPAFQQAQQDSANFDPGSYGFDGSPEKEAAFAKLKELSKSNPRFNQTVRQFEDEIGEVAQVQNQIQQVENHQPDNSGVFGFNLSRKKVAQNSNFPVQDAGDFAAKFFARLVTDDPHTYAAAAEEILSVVRGEIQEEEVNSMIESLSQLDNERDQAKAICILGQMFDILPSRLKAGAEAPAPMESQVMSEKNPKGIIKFNLSDHILNNKTSENVIGMTKTAADHFGQEYMLYGPTEKRICPKLRGKGGGQPGSGDVVSEYICRHHCLDGIVIDDNKTICGEALWRANSMDKQSREYVDADGQITGGYIEKRFIVEHNVPEENKMRLKPGETRKPRPAAWGNTESRMQDMRQKEADKRNFRPDSNTGDAFEWSHDQDQNNVEQSQSTRDSREEASGHQTVQYTNKDKQENKPKLASAWSAPSAVEAAHTMFRKGLSEDQVRNELKSHVVQNVADAAVRNAKMRVEKENLMQPGPNSKTASAKGFNLSHKKIANGPWAGQYPKPVPGQYPEPTEEVTRSNEMAYEIWLDKERAKKNPWILERDKQEPGGRWVAPFRRDPPQKPPLKSPTVAAKCDCGKDKCECKNPADSGEAYSTMLNRRFREEKKSFNLRNHKTAQFGSIPIPNDSTRSDNRLEDPKIRPKPMLWSPRPGGSESGLENTDPNHEPHRDEPLQEEPPQEEQPVLVPGGDVVNPEEAEKRSMKELGFELMDYNGGQFTAIYRVSSSWTTGNEVSGELVAAAYEELADAVNPEKVKFPEAITQEMKSKVQQLQEKLRPFMEEQPEPHDMRMTASASAWWTKKKS